MDLRLESTALEPPAGNFDREYWKSDIKSSSMYEMRRDEGVLVCRAKRDEDIYIVRVKKTLQDFLRLGEKNKRRAMGTRRFIQAYEALFYSLSTLGMMKAIFNEIPLTKEECEEMGVKQLKIPPLRAHLVEKMIESREKYGLQEKYKHFEGLLARYKKQQGER